MSLTYEQYCLLFTHCRCSRPIDVDKEVLHTILRADPLLKVRNLIDHCNATFPKYWEMSTHIAVDEMIVKSNSTCRDCGCLCGSRVTHDASTGRYGLSGRQPNKPTRDGIKVFAVCDKAGYVWLCVVSAKTDCVALPQVPWADPRGVLEGVSVTSGCRFWLLAPFDHVGRSVVPVEPTLPSHLGKQSTALSSVSRLARPRVGSRSTETSTPSRGSSARGGVPRLPPLPVSPCGSATPVRTPSGVSVAGTSRSSPVTPALSGRRPGSIFALSPTPSPSIQVSALNSGTAMGTASMFRK